MNTQPADPRVDELLIDWELQRQNGTPVTPEDLCRACPELLELLKHRIAEQLKVSQLLATPTEAETKQEGGNPSQEYAGLAETPVLALPNVPGYEILDVLGRGGMGVVYRARQLKLNRIVALKMILSGGHAGPSELARFVTEAEAVAALQHANIVQIFETGQHEGLPYFTLEFAGGGSLSAKVRDNPLPPREAAQIVEQLARGMDYAHSKGVVHRDLKPENVLLAEDGTPKVSDFGLAKRLQFDDAAPRSLASGLTQTGAIMGTPSYMAPEQAKGQSRKVGPAADIYALGAILYRLLSGRPPFQAATSWETIQQVVREEPVPLRKLNHRIPRDLETIALKCLQKEPQHRYATDGALAEDLRRWLDGEPILARPVGMVEKNVRRVRRHPVSALSTLLVLVLGLGAFGGQRLWKMRRAAIDRAKQLADAQTETGQYFASYTRNRREPVGIGLVNEEEAYALPIAFRIVRRGQLVDRIEVVNGLSKEFEQFLLPDLLGRPNVVIDSGRYRTIVFKRDESGRVVAEQAFDAWNQLIWALEYGADDNAAFVDRRGENDSLWAGRTNLLKLDWSIEGWLESIRFSDGRGQATVNSDGVQGLRLSHAPDGRLLAVGQIDETGKLRSGKRSAAERRAAYDERGRIADITCFSPDGTPTIQHLVHRTHFAYAPDGVAVTYFDRHGKPAIFFEFDSNEQNGLAGSGGYHKRVLVFSERGQQILEYLRLVDDQPWRGFSHHLRMRFTDKGQIAALEFLDAAGKVQFDKANGYAKISYDYDNTGHLRERIIWRTNHRGELVVSKRSDAHMNPLELATFAADGRPILNADGHHRILIRYNDFDKPTEYRLFGVDGKPIAVGPDKAHCSKYEYDQRGNRIAGSYFDEQDRPTLSAGTKTHRWTDRFDSERRSLEINHYGTSGKHMVSAYGFAKLTSNYDFFGILAEKTRYVVRPNGQLALSKRENKDGKILEDASFDAAGNPTLFPGLGIHHARYRYDERGNTIESAYFDENDRPTMTLDGGIHRWVHEYDAKNRETVADHYDIAGKHVVAKWGMAKAVTVYDSTDRLLERQFFVLDSKGELVLQRRENKDGKVLENATFDAKGNPTLFPDIGVHRMRFRYDERGNCVEASFFDGVDRKMVSTENLHRWVDTYDSKNRQVSNENFGVDGKRVVWTGGWSKWTNTYNSTDQVVEKQFFVLDRKGELVLQRRENKDGKLLEEASFAIDGTPNVFPTSRAHRVRNRYDERNNWVESAFFDINDKPVLAANHGSHRWVERFDEKNRAVEGTHFGIDGKPMNNKVGGIAKWADEYDDKGKFLVRRQYVVDAKGVFQLKQ